MSRADKKDEGFRVDDRQGIGKAARVPNPPPPATLQLVGG